MTMLFIGHLVYGQENKITNNLTQAWNAYDEANDADNMSKATQMFSDISDNNKGNWLAAYWSSYLNTQTGRLMSIEDRLPYYEKAQLYLDRALKAKKIFTSNEKSELNVLQSLIYSLSSSPYWAKGERENGIKYSNLKQEYLNQAIIYNSNNPRIYVLAGTGLLADGARNDDYGYILAGRIMLETARNKYESEIPISVLHPNWGKEWIKPWLSSNEIPSASQN